MTPNAKHVRPLGRPGRKYDARRTTITLIVGNYAKTAARPKGQYHAIVSNFLYNDKCRFPLFFLFALYFV